MLDLRCPCGKKIAEYDDTTISIMDKKCKKVTTLKVIDGKLFLIYPNPMQDTSKLYDSFKNFKDDKLVTKVKSPVERVLDLLNTKQLTLPKGKYEVGYYGNTINITNEINKELDKLANKRIPFWEAPKPYKCIDEQMEEMDKNVYNGTIFNKNIGKKKTRLYRFKYGV